jgi:hypothetical protein
MQSTPITQEIVNRKAHKVLEDTTSPTSNSSEGNQSGTSSIINQQSNNVIINTDNTKSLMLDKHHFNRLPKTPPYITPTPRFVPYNVNPYAKRKDAVHQQIFPTNTTNNKETPLH